MPGFPDKLSVHCPTPLGHLMLPFVAVIVVNVEASDTPGGAMSAVFALLFMYATAAFHAAVSSVNPSALTPKHVANTPIICPGVPVFGPLPIGQPSPKLLRAVALFATSGRLLLPTIVGNGVPVRPSHIVLLFASFSMVRYSPLP